MNTFDRAKDHIQTHGFHKGGLYADRYNPKTSAACLMGALLIADEIADELVDSEKVDDVIHDTLNDVIKEQYRDRIESHYDGMLPLSSVGSLVASFNDLPETTIEEAIAVLEKASVKHEERV